MNIKIKPFRWCSDFDEDNRYRIVEWRPKTNELVETTIYGWPTINGRRDEIDEQYVISEPTIEQILDAWIHGYVSY